MASARHFAIDSDVRFTCSLCMEPYRGRTPKLLPCFHTFCLPCLESIATSAALKRSALYAEDLKTREEVESEDEYMKRKAKAEQEKNDRDVDDDIIREKVDANATFQCPLCHVTILVPEGGVSHFQQERLSESWYHYQCYSRLISKRKGIYRCQHKANQTSVNCRWMKGFQKH